MKQTWKQAWEELKLLPLAVARAIEANTAKNAQYHWEQGYKCGYEIGKSKREERRRAMAAARRDGAE